MKIKMCAFIPRSLGTSLSMCDLPGGLANQSSFNSEVRKTHGSWLKEPYPSTVFCGTDNREFGNVYGTNRLFAIKTKAIDLSKIGRLQASIGSKSKLFDKDCSPSHRLFVQTSSAPLSIWQMNKSPRIHYQGGRIAYIDHNLPFFPWLCAILTKFKSLAFSPAGIRPLPVHCNILEYLQLAIANR